MDAEKPTESTPEIHGIYWESELTRSKDGSVNLKALQPVSQLSRKQAAKALGCTEQVITNLFKLGLLKGYKPGGWRPRKDGRASNAKLVLDSASVLDYKKRQERAAQEWRDAQ